MQAAATDRFGGIDEIKLQTLPVPEIGPDEVLIRVASAGVGEWDPFEREGGYAEMLGIEQSGVAITAVRGLDDTLSLKPGESVMIFGASGGVGHMAVLGASFGRENRPALDRFSRSAFERSPILRQHLAQNQASYAAALHHVLR